MNLEAINDGILQTILGMVQDPIPNIRFNVAKSLEVLATTLAKTGTEGTEIAKTKVIPAIQTLQNDSDADVRFFASKAIANVQNI